MTDRGIEILAVIAIVVLQALIIGGSYWQYQMALLTR